MIRIEYQLENIKHIAAELIAKWEPGTCIGLSGQLGAGKTTLIRFMLYTLGVQNVTSPTYNLQNEYELSSGLRIEHWDLYRISVAPEELLESPGPDVVRIIEWPERVPEVLDSLDQLWKLEYGDHEKGRILMISSHISA